MAEDVITEPPAAEPDPPELATHLRRLRRSAGMSQQQMARALGLSSHSSIAYYETGRRIPPADIVDAYEEALTQPPGSLHRLRLNALSARVEREEPVSAAVSGPGSAPGKASDSASGSAPAGPAESGPLSGSAPNEPSAPRRSLLLRRPRSVWFPAAVIGAFVVATASASAAGTPAPRAALDKTWSQSTQNVTDRIEPSTAPEVMDGDDPRARDCYFDAVVVQTVPLLAPDGTQFGTLRLRHSAHCAASWGSAYYRNPQLYTIRIFVHRQTDNALIRDDWSSDTPPGSYSDMLSTLTGCVWVSAEVITPTATSAVAKTGCVG